MSLLYRLFGSCEMYKSTGFLTTSCLLCLVTTTIYYYYHHMYTIKREREREREHRLIKIDYYWQINGKGVLLLCIHTVRRTRGREKGDEM